MGASALFLPFIIVLFFTFFITLNFTGPHTPPSFYQNHIVPKCCLGNQWGSLTSSHHNHENSMWPSTVDSPELKTNQHKEVLPSFSLFGPENFNNSVSGSGGDLLNICGSKNMLNGSYCSSGKRSPIMGEFMNGLLSGRRSSHTPLLDEGGGESAQAMLDMLLEPGSIQKVNNHRANRSVEVLSRAKGSIFGQLFGVIIASLNFCLGSMIEFLDHII